MIALRQSYVNMFEGMESFELVPGRILAVSLHIGQLRILFICGHIFTNPNDVGQRRSMLQTVSDFIAGRVHHLIFILGDFNFVVEQNDRTDLSTGLAIGRQCSVAKFWVDHFWQFDELHQQSHTRFPGNLTEGRSSARLDRIYCNAPLEAFALWEVQAATLGQLPDAYLSDHLPVVARIAYKNSVPCSSGIPHFVTKDKLFNHIVDIIMNQHNFSPCCWARVSEVKDIFYSAYAEFRDHANHRGALLAKERIYWALQAIRASDTNNLHLFLKAVEAAPQLQHDSFTGQLPIAYTHLALIRGVLQDALRADDADKQAELEHSSTLPEYARQRLTDNLLKKLALHNPKRRKLGIEAVRGCNGQPILDKTAAGDHLSKFWGGKFQEQAINESEASAFTGNFSTAFPIIQCLLRFATFAALVVGAKKSAPGPDGVPYSAWASNIRA